jgi:hypothetical protein
MGDKKIYHSVLTIEHTHIVRVGIMNPSLSDSAIKKSKVVDKEKKEEESRQIEEIKMLDDIPNDPLS